MKKKTKQSRTRIRQKAPTVESSLPEGCCSLEQFAEKIGIKEDDMMEVFYRHGFLHNDPGKPWHNMPTQKSIDDDLFKVVQVDETPSDDLEGLALSAVVEIPTLWGHPRIVGGSEGDVLFRLRTYAEHETEWFDIV